MKKLLRKTILFSFWLSSFALAEGNVQQLHTESGPIPNLSSSISCVVTTHDYPCFLNNVAKSDPDFLYDEKMGTDPKAACIIRLGSPGKFHYEVIAGRENVPISYLNQRSAERYAAWANAATTATSLDPELKSNSSELFLENETPSLSMMQPGDVEAGSEAVDVVETMAAALSGVALGEMGAVAEQVGESAESNYPAESEEQLAHPTAEQLTLDTLRTVSESHPDVMHWTLDEQGTLQASEENDAGKNMTIVHRLNDLLKEKYSPAIAKQMLALSGHHENVIDPLSSAHLQRIFTQLDRIENRRSEIKQFFHRCIRERQQQFFYDTADDAWNGTLHAWGCQRSWESIANLKQSECEIAEQLLKAAAEERAKVDPEKTKLGAVAKFLKKAAPIIDRIVTWLPKPMPLPLGTACEKLGEVLEGINDYAVNGDLNKAQAAFDQIEEEKENALTQEAQARNKAHKKDHAAWSVEKSERKAKEAAIKTLSDQIKSPTSSLDPSAWESWASSFEREEIKIDLIKHGMNDPRWMEQMLAEAWQEGIRSIKAKLHHLKAERNFPEQLAQEKELHQEAQVASENLALLKAREEAALHEMEQTMRVALQAQQDYQKNKSTNNHLKLERAQRLQRQKENAFFQVHQELIEVERNAEPILTQQKFLRERLQRKIERAQIELSASKAAWKSFLSDPQKMEFHPVTQEEVQEKIPPPLIYDAAAEKLGRKFAREKEEAAEAPLAVAADAVAEGAKISSEEKEHRNYLIPEITKIDREDEERVDAFEKIQQIMAAQQKAKKKLEIAKQEDEESVYDESETASTVSRFSKAAEKFEQKQKLAEESLCEARNAWKKLVRQRAEQFEKENALEKSFDESVIDWSAWQALDQELLDLRKEERRAKRRNFLQAKMAKESLRWEVFAHASEAEEAIKAAIQEQEEKAAFELQTSQHHEDHLQQSIDNPAMSLEEIWKAWNQLADEHPSVAILQGAEPTVIEAAKQKLKEADEAALQVKAREAFKVLERNNRNAFKQEPEDQYEPSLYSLAKPSSRRRFAIREYQRNLLARKNKALDVCSKEWITSPEKALQNYQAKMEQAALEGARSNSLIARQAWQNLVEQSFEIFKREIEGAASYARAIAEVDWKALHIFKEELERVNYIKEKLTSDNEEGERKLKRERDRAAEAYFDGDDTLWNALPPEQRAAYNEGVAAANESYYHKLSLFKIEYELTLEAVEGQISSIQKNLEKINNTVDSFSPFENKSSKEAKRDQILQTLKKTMETCDQIKNQRVVEKNQLQLEQIKIFQQMVCQSFIAAGKLKIQKAFFNESDLSEELREVAAMLYCKAGIHFEKAIDAWSKNKSLVETNCDKIAKYFYKSANSYEEALESSFIGDEKQFQQFYQQATFYDKMAILMQAVAKIPLSEYKNKGSQTKRENNDIDKECSYMAAKAASNAIEQLNINALVSFENAEKEFKNSQYESTALYIQNAKLHQNAAEYYIKAATILTENNKVDVTKWNKAADAVKAATGQLSNRRNVADSLQKADIASKKGHHEIAHLLIQSVQLNKTAAEHFIKASIAFIEDSEVDATKWNKVGEIIQAAARQLGDWGGQGDSLENVDQAFKENKHEITALWIRNAQLRQTIARYFINLATAVEQDQEVDFDKWNKIADYVHEAEWQLSANSLGAVALIENADHLLNNGDDELAALYTRSAQLKHQAGENLFKVATACMKGDEVSRSKWWQAACANKQAAFRLGYDVTHSLQDANIASKNGQQEIAALYVRSAQFYQIAVEHYIHSVTTIEQKNDVDIAKKYYKSAEAASDAAEELRSAANSLQRAEEASKNNQQEIAGLYTQNVDLRQTRSDYYIKIATSLTEENEVEAAKWHKVVEISQKAANLLGDNIAELVDASKKNLPEKQSLWRERNEWKKEVAECYLAAAQALVIDDEVEAMRWNEAAENATMRQHDVSVPHEH